MNQRNDNILAFTWYRKEEYEKLLEVTPEPEELASDYEQWLEEARQAFDKYERMGFDPRRVHMEVDEYVAWCETRDRDIDQHSRELYKEIRRQEFYRDLDDD